MDKKIGLSNNDEQALTEIAQPSPVAQVTQTSSKKSVNKPLMLVVGILLFIGIAAGLNIYNNKQSNSKKPAANNTSKQQTTENSAPATTILPQSLYEQSKTVNGTTVGYVKKEQAKKTGFNISKRVYAEELQYETYLFFVNGGKIHGLNTETKEDKIMSEAADVSSKNPAFSSVTQMLAYTNENDLIVKSVSASSEEPNKISDSYGTIWPITWSPDGTRLFAYILPSAAPGTDAYASAKFAVYSTNTQKLSVLSAPNGFNNVADTQNIEWLNNNDLNIEFAQKTKFGEFTSKSWFKLSVDTNNTVQITLPYDNVATVRRVGEEVFFKTGGKLVYAPKTDLNKQTPIQGGDLAGIDYLVRQNTQTQKASDIIYADGTPGSQDSFVFVRINLADQKPEELYRPGGFSASILGWSKDYSSFIYMSYQSGKSEVHLYNLTDKKDTLLLGDLPLI